MSLHLSNIWWFQVPLVVKLYGTFNPFNLSSEVSTVCAIKMRADERVREYHVIETAILWEIVPSDLCTQILLTSVRVAHMYRRAEYVPLCLKKTLGQIVLSITLVGPH